jgi:biotin carboxyl carrier protein
MHRKFRISVDGRPYDVVVEEIAEDGALHAPHPLAPVAVAAAPVAAAVAAPRPVAKVAAGAGAELAPLAGVVVSIDAAVGQQVAVGDKIAVIEAMKMKTDVFAKGAGKVASVSAKVGEAVDAGDALLTLA